MSPIDYFQIKRIFNFGGKLQFVNCGAKDKFIALVLQKDALEIRAESTPMSDAGSYNDFQNAFNGNLKQLNDLRNSESYHQWIGNRDKYELEF